MKEITFPLQIGVYGLPKTGKSHFAAGFVKELNGLIIEPVWIQQLPPKKGTPARYVVDQSPCGHSAYALRNVGIDFKEQYRYVKSWDEYQKAIEKLCEMAFDSPKRLWLVIDDTDQWRRLYAYHLAVEVNKRTQITKDEYMQAGGDLVAEMSRLKNLFNVIYISQTKDEYVGENPTGNQVAAIYPANAKFLYEVYGRIWKDHEKHYRNFDIEALTVIDSIGNMEGCEGHYSLKSNDFPEGYWVNTIRDVSPTKLLETCKIDKEMW